jgi:hypothetical protein
MNFATAQPRHLSKKISISIENESLDAALKEIEKKGNFNFSYNSEIISGDNTVSLNVENQSVQKVLKQLLGGSIRYKSVGNHIVLLNGSGQSISKDRRSEYVITGYIVDSRTGHKLKHATIYEVDGKRSSLTNDDGFFSINLPAKNDICGLSFSKHGYLDTVLVVRPAEVKDFYVSLKEMHGTPEIIKPKEASVEPIDIHDKKLVNLLVPNETRITSENLKINETRLLHFSVLPFIGTNRKISGSVVNTFSFNLFAGYSGGVEVAEVGGFLNIDRGNVSGVQIGGFGNVVGGETNAVQVAGFFNLNAGNVKGAQIAGFSNVVADTLTGIQVAGFHNMLKGKMNGHQISGFNNVTLSSVDGAQVTGGVNIAKDDVKIAQISGLGNFGGNIGGVQVAGYLNIAYGDVGKAQIAGFANYAKSVDGLQISGFANISSEKNKGAQIAGLLNYSDTVNGLQLACINISDTVESGVPIGLISLVRKGFHMVEFSTDETFYTNLSIKTGVNRFYNIFKVGGRRSNIIAFLYGLGTRLNPGHRLSVDMEITSGTVFKRSEKLEFMGVQTRFSPVLDFRPGKSFSIFVGPSISLYAARNGSESYNFIDISSDPFYDEIHNTYRVQSWWGGTGGLRFLF